MDRSPELDNHRLAFFYCSRGVEVREEGSWEAVLHALLRQLATDRYNRCVIPTVADAFNESKAEEKHATLSIERCLSLLQDLVASGIRVRIIIDALDECENYSALLRELEYLTHHSKSNLQVLLSSRAEVDVPEYFPDCSLIDVNESMPIAEIENYLTMEIKSSHKSQRLFNGAREDLEDDLIAVLLDRSERM